MWHCTIVNNYNVVEFFFLKKKKNVVEFCFSFLSKSNECCCIYVLDFFFLFGFFRVLAAALSC